MFGKKSRPLRASSLVVAALLVAGCHTGDKAAEQIVEKNTAARGGLKAWRLVQAMSMSGTLEAGVARDPVQLSLDYLRAPSRTKAEVRKAVAQGQGGAEKKQVRLPFVMELKRPRKSRLEIRFQGDTAVQVFDGSRGWKVRPFLGRREVEPYSAEELRLASMQADLDGLLIDSAGKGSRVKLLATEKVEGRDAYKLQVTSSAGQVRNVWVDTKTYLDVKVDGTRWMDGKQRAVFTTFRDWRAVGGLQLPHTLETTVEGVAGSEKIVIDRVAVNPELAVARFEKPEK